MKLLVPEKFKQIKTKKCTKHKSRVTRKICNQIKQSWTNIKAKRLGIDYVAKLNVPLLPKHGFKQTVIGTSKYLLPYLVLNKYFNIFVIDPYKWNIKQNMNLLVCIAKQFINTGNIIRIVTTPLDLVDETNHYRITAEEICVLKQYNYSFYKYNSKLHNNIYFCSKVPLTNCSEVDSSDGSFKCTYGAINKFLYF